ncbi:hypothetical protein KAJ27_17550 [bacterium]|nr:hypothetical protein [bacterium]
MLNKAIIPVIILILIFQSGCGEKKPELLKNNKKIPQKVVKKTVEDINFTRGKKIAFLLKKYYNRGGYMNVNIDKGIMMHPEKSRLGFQEVIRKKANGWDWVIRPLSRFSDPGNISAELLLKILKKDGYTRGQSAAAYGLGRLKYTPAGPEILKYIKTINPKGNLIAFTSASKGLVGTVPNGTLEFAVKILTSKEKVSGKALGCLAEVLGYADAKKAMEILPDMLKKESWDPAGYIGVIRGLGATKDPRARQLLIDFYRNWVKLWDGKKTYQLRNYGEAIYACYGELTRFDDPEVREILMAHNGGFTNLFKDEENKVKEYIERIPDDFKKAIGKKWAHPPWANVSSYDSTKTERRLRTLGESMIGAELDQKFKASVIEKLNKWKGKERYDGNVRVMLMKLFPYAESGDKEVISIFYDFARPGDYKSFSSRGIARQELMTIKDPKLLDLLIKSGFFGRTSGWTRIDGWDISPPYNGLSKAFLNAKLTGGFRGTGINPVVFQYLGREADPEVFSFIKKEIKKSLPDPRKTLLSNLIWGLKYWNGKEADQLLQEIVDVYKKEGIPEKGFFRGIKAKKIGNMIAAYHVLAIRGDKTAFEKVYKRRPDIFNVYWKGIPEEYKHFVKKDYGPFGFDWPTR